MSSDTIISPEAIEQRLLELIVSFGPEPELVTREATLETLDLDSLDLVEMAQVAEDEFGVKLETEDFKDVTTVGDAIDVIKAKAAA